MAFCVPFVPIVNLFQCCKLNAIMFTYQNFLCVAKNCSICAIACFHKTARTTVGRTKIYTHHLMALLHYQTVPIVSAGLPARRHLLRQPLYITLDGATMLSSPMRAFGNRVVRAARRLREPTLQLPRTSENGPIKL